jgi:membrane-bound serine protease (ClpP class)
MNAFGKLSTMIRLARHARRQKLSPQSEIVGLMGRAETSLAPDGMVFVRNELWHARSPLKIEAGQNVIVNGIEGLALRVEAQ